MRTTGKIRKGLPIFPVVTGRMLAETHQGIYWPRDSRLPPVEMLRWRLLRSRMPENEKWQKPHTSGILVLQGGEEVNRIYPLWSHYDQRTGCQRELCQGRRDLSGLSGS